MSMPPVARIWKRIFTDLEWEEHGKLYNDRQNLTYQDSPGSDVVYDEGMFLNVVKYDGSLVFLLAHLC